MADVLENPHAPAGTRTQSMEGAVTLERPEAVPLDVPAPPEPELGATLLENPHAPAGARTQSMEGAVTLERPEAAPPALEPAPALELGATLRENPHAPAGAHTQSMEGAVTVERPEAAAAPSEPLPRRMPDVPTPAPVPAPPQPRLRCSWWFEGDVLKMESVLMTNGRELVHRETVELEPGGMLERVHTLLLTVAATRARNMGRVRAPEPALEPEPEPEAAASDEVLTPRDVAQVPAPETEAEAET